MLEGFYYLLFAFTIILFIIAIFFSVYRINYTDKTGRTINASILIVIPLVVVNLIIIVILAFESGHIEIPYVDAEGIMQIKIIELIYMMWVMFGYFLINLLVIFWNVFQFFIEAFYEPQGKIQH